MDLISQKDSLKEFSNNFNHDFDDSDGNKFIQLDDRIHGVDIRLKKQISDNHEQLLVHCVDVGNIEQHLINVQKKMQAIRERVFNLQQKVSEKYRKLEEHTNRLKNVYITNEHLKAVSRFQQLLKCYQDCNTIIQKSSIIHEFDILINESSLQEVAVLSIDIRELQNQKAQIVKVANSNLLKGLSQYNTSEVNEALKIFYNLDMLNETCTKMQQSFIDDCNENLKFALNCTVLHSDKNAKNSPISTNKMSTEDLKFKFWSNLEVYFKEDIPHSFKQMDFLCKNLLSLNENCKELYKDKYSDFLLEILKKMSNCLVNVPKVTRRILENDYPNLLKCYQTLFSKLSINCSTEEYFNILKENWEPTYLTKSLKKFQDCISGLISNNLASIDDVDSTTSDIVRELLRARVSSHLFKKVEENVSLSVNNLGIKIEQKVITDSSATQIIEKLPNHNQQRNTSLANFIYHFKIKLLENARKSSLNLSDDFIKNLQQLDKVYATILQPLIASINVTVDKIVLTIYYEKDWEYLDIQNINICSPYMKELTQFLTRVQKSYLSTYDNKDILNVKCKEVAQRTLELFIRHSLLLKPISKGGRFRLQYDYGFLEKSMRNFYGDLNDLGPIYQLFKSMELLINSDPEEIVTSEMLESEPSTILLLLFSYAESNLANPFRKRKWSAEKCSQWLDQHNEQDRLELISSTLREYEESVNPANYDPVYRLMKNVINVVYQDN